MRPDLHSGKEPQMIAGSARTREATEQQRAATPSSEIFLNTP
jgi:hypothetical protein